MRIWCAAVAALALNAVVTANEPEVQAESQPSAHTLDGSMPDLHESDELHLAITPLIWFTSFNGTTGVRGLKFDVDESFLDIVDNSETVFGLMGAIDAEYKRWVFQLNGVYSTATFDNHAGRARSGPLGGGASVSVDADVKMDVAWLEAFAGYRFIDTPIGKDPASHSRLTFDGFLGGRITMMDLDLDVRTDTTITLPGGGEIESGRSNSIDDDKSWFEPFIGARLNIDLGKHWNITFRGDVGGFVDDSELAWSALAAVGYRWQMDGWTLNLFGGYRALGQDYEDSGFTWDAITHGPVLGAVFAFSF